MVVALGAPAAMGGRASPARDSSGPPALAGMVSSGFNRTKRRLDTVKSVRTMLDSAAVVIDRG